MASKSTTQWSKLIIGVIILYAIVKVLMLMGIMNNYWQRVLDFGIIMTIGSLGLSLIYGFTGQFSIGHAAWFGLGAYAAGYVGKTMGAGLPNFLLALAVGTLFAALIGYLVGLPVLRLTSDYLGIATLGFGIIVKVLLDNIDKVIPALGGAVGMTGVPQTANFEWILGFLLLSILICRNFVYSTFGRACTSIREDEIATNSVGVNPARYKMISFVIGCGLAGLAGGLYAFRYPFLHPMTFDFLQSFNFLIIVVAGGLGSLTGTVVTGIGWAFLLEGLRFVLGQAFVDFRGVIYAFLLIVVVLVRQQGLFGGKEIGLLVPRIQRRGKRDAVTGSL